MNMTNYSRSLREWNELATPEWQQVAQEINRLFRYERYTLKDVDEWLSRRLENVRRVAPHICVTEDNLRTLERLEHAYDQWAATATMCIEWPEEMYLKTA